MREFFHTMKVSFLLAAILYVILGLVLLLWPGVSAVVFCYAFGGVLLAYGVVTVVSFFLRARRQGGFVFELLLGIIAAALGLLGRGRALGLCRRGVGEDHLDAGDLVVLGQVLKDRVQFLLIQILAGLLGGVKILAQNVDDLPGLHPEILRQLIHLILVYDTQIWSPPKEIKVHAP